MSRSASPASAGAFASARRPVMTALQHMEIRDAANGVDGARPIPRQALANRYGVSLEDVNRIVNDPDKTAAPVVLDRSVIEKAREASRQEDRAFARQWQAGVSIADLASQFRLSGAGVKARRVRLGLDPRSLRVRQDSHWTPEKDAVIRREFLVAGKSASAVAKILQVSRNALVGRAHRLGYVRMAERA